MSSLTYEPLVPERASSRTPIRVRFCETDLMGIVHHASYLTYFEVGRVEWLRARGVTFARWAEEGLHLAVIEAALQYKAPARFDDLLDLETVLAELRAASMTIRYVLRRGDAVVAEGSTKLACVDEAQRVRRIPQAMRDVLLSGEL